MEQKIIVHVEEERLFLKLFQRELKELFGDDVVYAAFMDPMTALDFLRNNKADLIISCLNMHGKTPDGCDFLMECKNLYPDTPFLLYTAMSYREDLTRPGAALADAYVVKSPDPTEIITSIRSSLRLSA